MSPLYAGLRLSEGVCGMEQSGLGDRDGGTMKGDVLRSSHGTVVALIVEIPRIQNRRCNSVLG